MVQLVHTGGINVLRKERHIKPGKYIVMRPLSGQVNIHLAQLDKHGLTLFYLMHLVYFYDQLSIENQRENMKVLL